MFNTYAHLVKDEFSTIENVKRRHFPNDGHKQFCIIGMFIKNCNCLMFDTDICTQSCLNTQFESRKKTASLYELVENPLEIRRKINNV